MEGCIQYDKLRSSSVSLEYLMLTGRKKPLPNGRLIITANARRRKETSPPTPLPRRGAKMQFLLRQYFFIISLGMAHETGVLSFFIWTHCLLHIYVVTLPVRRKDARQLSFFASVPAGSLGTF
jgi:hypothetical protein